MLATLFPTVNNTVISAALLHPIQAQQYNLTMLPTGLGKIAIKLLRQNSEASITQANLDIVLIFPSTVRCQDRKPRNIDKRYRYFSLSHLNDIFERN